MDGHRLGLLGSLVKQAQLDFRTRAPGQHIHGLVRAHPLGGRAVDLHDLVAGQHAGLVRRGAHHGGDDPQPPRLRINTNLDANPAELAFDLLAELFPFAGVDIRGMLVQALEHSLQGILEQFPARDRTDIIRFDLFHGIDKQPVQLEHLVLGLGPLRRLPAEQAECHDHGHGKDVPSWNRHVPLLVPEVTQNSVTTTRGPAQPFTFRGLAIVAYTKV